MDDENAEDHRNNVHHKASLDKICDLDAVSAKHKCLWWCRAGGAKAMEHRQVANVSILIGCVSVDRATAVFGAISVKPEMLKTVKESSPKLEKSLKQTNSSPRQAVSEDSLQPFKTAPSTPMRRVTPTTDRKRIRRKALM